MKRAIKNGDVEEVARRALWDAATARQKLWLTLRGRAPSRRLVRCKWCGRHTPRARTSEIVDPKCRHCARIYPDPDLYWDSMEGFSYCAGRGSWLMAQDDIEGEWDEFYLRHEARMIKAGIW